MSDKNILTKEGIAELKKELNNLINVERPKVIEEIKDARAQGDLSENAEFDAAREKQGQIEDRVKEIEIILENSQVVRTSSASKKVRVGSKVTILDLKTNNRETFSIVGTLEADPFEHKISNKSPLALAMMDKVEGDTVTVEVKPKYNIKIEEINNG